MKIELKDLIKQINNDIICIQPNGKFSKWCKPLNCIAFYNEPIKKYYDYYLSQTDEYLILTKVIDDKLKYDTISPEEFIELVKNGENYVERERNLNGHELVIYENDSVLKAFEQ